MKDLKAMTKKERKAYFKQFRNEWPVNPITRKENKNKYKEKKYNEKAKCNSQTF